MGMHTSSVWKLCLLLVSVSGIANAQLLSTSMTVQGSIFCLSGNKATPLKGAKARIDCRTLLGAPFGIVSGGANDNGFYTASSRTGVKLSTCKVVLHSSPAWSCRFPTDINGGKFGASLIGFSSGSTSFSVKPFFYAPN